VTGAGISARLVDAVIDRGLLPDRLLRLAIRGLLRRRRQRLRAGDVEARDRAERAMLALMDSSPVTLAVDEANDQHYEVPAAFFTLLLGPRLKYSSAWWPPGVTTLAGAEDAMLALTAERALLRDGQDVLELGCGWGSLTLWMAERYPRSRITAVSNSRSQAEHIRGQARERGLTNVQVVTADVGYLGVADAGAALDAGPTPALPAAAFDRVVSVEMFEHVRNQRELGRRIARWLRPGGHLFVHVFSHTSQPYTFETASGGDWMARNFFTGGMMPSHDLLLLSIDALVAEERWAVSGRHYARTLQAWHHQLEQRHDEAVALLAGARGGGEAAVRRWKVFLIACEELFAVRGGDEWHVTHLRFVRPAAGHYD